MYNIPFRPQHSLGSLSTVESESDRRSARRGAAQTRSAICLHANTVAIETRRCSSFRRDNSSRARQSSDGNANSRDAQRRNSFPAPPPRQNGRMIGHACYRMKRILSRSSGCQRWSQIWSAICSGRPPSPPHPTPRDCDVDRCVSASSGTLEEAEIDMRDVCFFVAHLWKLYCYTTAFHFSRIIF